MKQDTNPTKPSSSKHIHNWKMTSRKNRVACTICNKEGFVGLVDSY